MTEKMMKKIPIPDSSRCTGCGACVVACMDQNDLFPEKGETSCRRIHTENRQDPNLAPQYVSAGCLHCDDSPCLAACPAGALYRDEETQAVLPDRERCTGCRRCAAACPFDVPRYDDDGKMHKCNLCVGRVKAGLQPACVRSCPFEALQFKAPPALPTG